MGHRHRVHHGATDHRADGGGEPYAARRLDAHPTGDPSLAVGDELAMRTRMLDRALDMLETDVEPRTVARSRP